MARLRLRYDIDGDEPLATLPFPGQRLRGSHPNGIAGAGSLEELEARIDSVMERVERNLRMLDSDLDALRFPDPGGDDGPRAA